MNEDLSPSCLAKSYENFFINPAAPTLISSTFKKLVLYLELKLDTMARSFCINAGSLND